MNPSVADAPGAGNQPADRPVAASACLDAPVGSGRRSITIADTHAHTTPSPTRTPDAWVDAAGHLLKRGETLVAYDLLRGALHEHPGHPRLTQLAALTLARCGATREAIALLEPLLDAGHRDEETLGLLGRTHKDLWMLATRDDDRARHLGLATRYYAEAYEASDGYWSGINAATLSLLRGENADAAALAQRVSAQCVEVIQTSGDEGAARYWPLATLGEAALVLGDLDAAGRHYREAVACAPGHLGDVVSTRRNARLLLRHRGLDESLLAEWLPVPTVVVFAGHLIDRPTRTAPRFPAALEPAVRAAIDEHLRPLGAVVGYAAAACGADLLFLEAVAARGGDTRVVLPYDREQFATDSVTYLPGSTWGARFDAALARASEVAVASEHRIGEGSASFEYGFRVLDGMAALRADELDADLLCLAVWDGLPGDGPGGTAQSVEHWRQMGRRVEVIDLAGLRGTPDSDGPEGPSLREQVRSEPPPASESTQVRPEPPPTHEQPPTHRSFDPQVVGLLFADAHGFSRLTEAELPVFVEHYLGLIARTLAGMRTPPLLVNTWGDGLYVVFRDVQDTGEFALRLCGAVRRTDWAALGLAGGLSVRIGLHAGPAYACLDPVTGRQNFIGAHVSRAARIEPIAPAGEVYASGAFAALARSAQVQAFTCTYVGQTPLAKGYGTFPTYIVRRGHDRDA